MLAEALQALGARSEGNAGFTVLIAATSTQSLESILHVGARFEAYSGLVFDISCRSSPDTGYEPTYWAQSQRTVRVEE